MIFRVVGAGVRDCRFQAIIAGETRPYVDRDFVGAGFTNNI